ncbi:PPK2 family polyphosphate kinase [Qipengyuania zhejiangensis]|uniref:PPK2 family polyphosphate kinase n=1 Tax=Qipengyuania zhejiangensis TaxID=3077782 RepID=UPI002D7795E8|nr:PPK2 family polyphosphate kinase [Qipengyuania sp. Z2]
MSLEYRSEFRIVTGQSVRLADRAPAYTGHDLRREDSENVKRAAVEQIDRLQYLLYAAAESSLLIVLQGMDAAGKDGVIRHLFTGLNPQGTRVHSFKQPTQVELAHDFLWRVHAQVPAQGEVAIFNRSHYEDVLVARVHRLAPEAKLTSRFDAINRFEHLLAENGTRILKFFLHISPQEQLERFRKRIEDPLRNWKISESDYSERENWPEYVKAYEDVLERTSTEWGPWFVIPSNHKWFRDLAISKIIAEEMESLQLHIPPPRVDLDDIRRKYHQTVNEERSIERETGL